MTTEDIFETAVRYRQSLEKIQRLAFQELGCQCNHKPNWQSLMDAGVGAHDPQLFTDGKMCFACQVEEIYEEALGTEAFAEQVAARIEAFLSENYKNPVAVPVYLEDGTEDEVIVEREDLERFLKEHNQDNL